MARQQTSLCSQAIANQQPDSFRMIIGERNVLELSGEDHKRVRDALMSFLKPECLKQYVGKMDGEVRRHLELHWEGQQKVTVCKTRAFVFYYFFVHRFLFFNILNADLSPIRGKTSVDVAKRQELCYMDLGTGVKFVSKCRIHLVHISSTRGHG